jgi:hypothetical protein
MLYMCSIANNMYVRCINQLEITCNKSKCPGATIINSYDMYGLYQSLSLAMNSFV